jgi:hypothetical protein
LAFTSLTGEGAYSGESSNAANPKMVWITGGEFTMGSETEGSKKNEQPSHQVTVDAFWMDEHDVTDAEFGKFVEATGYKTTAEPPVDWEELKKSVLQARPSPRRRRWRQAPWSATRSRHPSQFLMKTNQHPIAHGALLCIALSVLTACQTTPTQTTPPDRFAAADANHDGKLSRDEVGDYLVLTLFEARDKNHDGKLTWEEWKVEGVEGQKARFDARDANHDGVVTLQEAQAYERKHHVLTKDFKKADTNGDGYLSRAEVQAFYGSKEGPPN